MKKEIFEHVKNQLKNHEGYSSIIYKCPAGKLTIGYGRNLESNGISKDEAELMLKNDINNAENQLMKEIPNIYSKLSDNRKSVLINMVFNMGIYNFMKFKKTIEFLSLQAYENASEEMLNSKWAKQVGKRAKDLSKIMLIG